MPHPQYKLIAIGCHPPILVRKVNAFSWLLKVDFYEVDIDGQDDAQE